MVDLDRVREKLAALQAYQGELRTIAPDEQTPLGRYSRRYLLQAGIQVCIDLANHLIASEGWKTATDYREAFVRLAEHGVIDVNLSARMQLMVGMRNRLVHLYDDVDDELVARAIEENLNDWDAYARAMAVRMIKRLD